jgi:hypothetical protein
LKVVVSNLDTLPSSLSTKHIATLRKPTDEMG